jgi:hypothetical protein
MKNSHNDLWIEGVNDRRQFLKLAGYGTLGLMAGGVWPLLGQTAAGQHEDAISKTGFVPDLDISLVAKPGDLRLTRVTKIGWSSFQGAILARS